MTTKLICRQPTVYKDFKPPDEHLKTAINPEKIGIKRYKID